MNLPMWDLPRTLIVHVFVHRFRYYAIRKTFLAHYSIALILLIPKLPTHDLTDQLEAETSGVYS